MTDYAKAWGRRIRHERRAMGLSQDALAKALRPPVTQSVVSQWEQGQCAPSFARTRELARVLRLEDADLEKLYSKVLVQ